MLGPAADQFPQKAAQRALLAGIRNFGHRIAALAEKSAGLQAAVLPFPGAAGVGQGGRGVPVSTVGIFHLHGDGVRLRGGIAQGVILRHLGEGVTSQSSRPAYSPL